MGRQTAGATLSWKENRAEHLLRDTRVGELLYNREIPALACSGVAGRVGELAERLKAAVC